MDVVIERCAGLDVHQGSIVVCVLKSGGPRGKALKEVRTFDTMTRRLHELAGWLKAEGVTHVGMEGTGVYWMPIYGVLEEVGGFELVVGNARHIAKVPGRKTDVKDAEWIAQLLRHGLIRKSFVPPKDLRAVRSLLRYRRGLVDARTAEKNRLLKVLETANVKLASVATNVFGKSGMLMLHALAEGDQTPEAMAELAKGLLRKKKGQLVLALEGRMEPHARDMLKMQLARLAAAEDDIAALEVKVAQLLAPYQRQLDLLLTIPGVDWVVAATLIAEVGVDMTAFPTPRHLASWTGVAPGNDESAGKRRNTSTTRGNVHLKTALVEGARAAAKKKGSYLRDKYYRLKARRGANRAAMALAHKMVKAAWHILAHQVPYKELGEAYLDERDKARVQGNLVRRLERLGYSVALTAKATASAGL